MRLSVIILLSGTLLVFFALYVNFYRFFIKPLHILHKYCRSNRLAGRSPGKNTHQIIIKIVAWNVEFAGLGPRLSQTDLDRASANFLFDSQVWILNRQHLSIKAVKPLPPESYRSFLLTTNREYLFFGSCVWELKKFIDRLNYVPTQIVGFMSFR